QDTGAERDVSRRALEDVERRSEGRGVHGGASMIRLELPFPPSALSPNARLPWQVKKGYTATYRQSCKVEALKVVNRAPRGTYPLQPPVKASVTFVLTSQRRRDMDNLIASIKACMDGIVDARVIPDDNAWTLSTSY